MENVHLLKRIKPKKLSPNELYIAILPSGNQGQKNMSRIWEHIISAHGSSMALSVAAKTRWPSAVLDGTFVMTGWARHTGAGHGYRSENCVVVPMVAHTVAVSSYVDKHCVALTVTCYGSGDRYRVVWAGYVSSG